MVSCFYGVIFTKVEPSATIEVQIDPGFVALRGPASMIVKSRRQIAVWGLVCRPGKTAGADWTEFGGTWPRWRRSLSVNCAGHMKSREVSSEQAKLQGTHETSGKLVGGLGMQTRRDQQEVETRNLNRAESPRKHEFLGDSGRSRKRPNSGERTRTSTPRGNLILNQARLPFRHTASATSICLTQDPSPWVRQLRQLRNPTDVCNHWGPSAIRAALSVGCVS